MNIADELRKLQDLHFSGALTDEEFAAAKAAVLANNAPASQGELEPAMVSHLEEIKRQNEVASLDREWDLERERFMMTGKHGHRYVPSQGGSAVGGIIIVVFGIFWTSMAASIGAPGFFPLFGVIFIIAGAGMSIYSFTMANEYQEAERRYRRRRSQLQGQKGARREE